MGVIKDRAPGIAGGTISGMCAPLLAAGLVASFFDDSGDGGCNDICWGNDNVGDDSGSSSSPIKPTTWGAFVGALAGSAAYGTKLAHDAYKVVGPPLKEHYKSILPPLFKGWGIGGVAGAAGTVAVVAAAEGIHYAYKQHQQHGQQHRVQNDPELGYQPQQRSQLPIERDMPLRPIPHHAQTQRTSATQQARGLEAGGSRAVTRPQRAYVQGG